MKTPSEEQRIRTLRNAAHDRDAEVRSPWEKLAAGELSQDEEATLRAEAEQSEDGRALLELYRPFDANEKQQLFERLRARVQAEPKPLPQRWRRGAVITAGVFAAAAAGMAFMYMRSPHPQVEIAQSESLGADPPAERLVAPDAELRLTFYPVHPIEETLVVRGALLVHDGRAIPWDPHPNKTSPDNKVRIIGFKKDLFPCLEAGEWRILVAVGVAGPAPSESDMIRLADQKSAGSYQVLSKRVWLDGPSVGSDGQPCRR